MKLVIAIVSEDDATKIMDKLRNARFSVTKIRSSGGFLRIGNSTLLSGMDDDKVQEFIDIIKKESNSHTASTPITSGFFDDIPMEVTVGGATIFILNVDQFIKV